VPFKELSTGAPGTSSAEMREAVIRAREIQRQRFASTRTLTNSRMTSRQIRQFCAIDDAARNILQSTMTELGLSARAHDKILRVARTIADLDGAEHLTAMHVNEAINYRVLDRKLWT
jgi:magnesium chelatase family protein